MPLAEATSVNGPVLLGASALLAIQVAVHWGCEVYVATRDERERERARELGAVWTGAYDELPVVVLDLLRVFPGSGLARLRLGCEVFPVVLDIG